MLAFVYLPLLDRAYLPAYPLDNTTFNLKKQEAPVM